MANKIIVTSAAANKMLKRLAEEKNYWQNKQVEGATYVAALDEEPLIPDYDYEKITLELEEINRKVLAIKHAINVNNVTNQVLVGDEMMTIDEILVKMAQLNISKHILDLLRKKEPKKRLNTGFSMRKAVPEYEYINYDLDTIKKDYEVVDQKIIEMQIALDKYNQTFEFEIEL